MSTSGVTHPSAFSNLHSPPEQIFVKEVARTRLLPTCCGTYAFHDRMGKLLYIGKAKNVRTRVLSHFRTSDDSSPLFPTWTKLIARIEMRWARSELEALLVEADLVARLLPPFNRQMRSWSQYCYLILTNDHAEPLSVSSQPRSSQWCFGPYRKRQQAVRIIEAVFRLITHYDDADMLAKCYRFLGGETNGLVVDLERQLGELVIDKKDEPWSRTLPHLIGVLRKASDRAVLLHNAVQGLNSLIVMPGCDDGRIVAVITDAGVHLEKLNPDISSAEELMQVYRRLVGNAASEKPRVPSKAISDCLCVAAQQIGRHPNKYRLIPMDQALDLSANDLLTFVFDASWQVGTVAAMPSLD